ncbi:hypothetical protein ACFVGM_23195 [Kitasatospora purpeofusca]|uniref:hypothetical protein n=1 Tax=Kitasatospora purpeofusca TaxID=67352 RepID=UPI0036AE4777
MTDRTISSPEPPEAESGTGGYCLICGDYGYGRYAGMRTALTDWITEHRACNPPITASLSRVRREDGDDRI